jgi:hypothetical protein
VQDTNGNYLEISYQGAGGRINTIQDTLGNTYTFQLENNHLRWLKYFHCMRPPMRSGTMPPTVRATRRADWHR